MQVFIQYEFHFQAIDVESLISYANLARLLQKNIFFFILDMTYKLLKVNIFRGIFIQIKTLFTHILFLHNNIHTVYILNTRKY